MADMVAVGPKVEIQEAVAKIAKGKFVDSARQVFAVLGYTSDRRIEIVPNTAQGFADQFGDLNSDRALISEWRSVDFLFQLTDEEIGNRLAFSNEAVDTSVIESYIFLGIQLTGNQYSRTRLATIAREINKLFPMPVMVLFRHGDAISLAVIDRELNKRDSTKDVLRKVTLIKDIRVDNPARAHIDILHELSLPVLYNEYQFRNFVELHRAWAKKLDSSDLNKRFYQDISYWYLWAKNHPGVKLPRDVDASSDEQRSIFFIRLLTRLIFCWFLQEKNLIPRRVFLWNQISGLLKEKSPSAGTYYKGILQNLFFATLNREISKRGFRDKATTGRFDKNRGVTTLYRYEDLLSDPAQLLKLFSEIPFVNGGLFDCLDDVYRKAENQPTVRLDGFSDNPRESVTLPNELFFGPDQKADLSKEFDDERKSGVSVHPLIEILARYKFTVEENTPLEEEIALDPELLGKVFENLLASYNDDTKTIARKKIGAFYTPRDVVRYMVDEALIFHFEPVVPQTKLRALLSDQPDNPCNEVETQKLISAIEKTRILDPACGSGAFPMGALHRLVYLLTKLDPNNVEWKHRQFEAAKRDSEKAESMEESGSREAAIEDVEARLKDIEASFDTRHHDLDYARKLYLIENSIFGVDIQPIACQIAKLRFFISLLVDQKSEKLIRPLPNLETRIVAANTLIPVEKAKEHQFLLGADQVNALREELRRVRHAHFNARTPEAKQRYRERDEAVRAKLAVELEHIGMPNTTARLLASWNPYDQNNHASFFDPEWMFSLSPSEFTGFDVVIGNPPYVRQEKIKEQKPAFKKLYDCFSGAADLYVYFYERGIQLLNEGGIFSFITSNKWMRSGYGEKLRVYLKSQTRVRRLIDFGDAEIFDAIAYPCIALLEKGVAPPDNAFKALRWEQEKWNIEDLTRHLSGDMFPMSQSDLASDSWRLESKTKIELLERVRQAGVPLGDHAKGRLYRGILTGLNEAFVVSREVRDELIDAHPSSAEILKPFLRGRDVKRWRVEYEDLFIIFTRRGIDIKQYPAIQRYLKQFKPQLEPCPDEWDTQRDGAWPGRKAGSYKWYEVQDNIAYWEEFEQPKIIVPAITDTVNFAPDTTGYYSNDKTSIVVPDSVPYTLAILNSQVTLWLAQQTFASRQGGFFEFKPMYVSQLPIPSTTEEKRNAIESLSKVLIRMKGNGSSAAYFERLLNGLVYELFFPEELHAAQLQLFDLITRAGLPKTTKQSDWEAFHEQVSNVNHPIYATLFALNGLETVRLIEGRE